MPRLSLATLHTGPLRTQCTPRPERRCTDRRRSLCTSLLCLHRHPSRASSLRRSSYRSSARQLLDICRPRNWCNPSHYRIFLSRHTSPPHMQYTHASLQLVGTDPRCKQCSLEHPPHCMYLAHTAQCTYHCLVQSSLEDNRCINSSLRHCACRPCITCK